jgi:hypothetical protein
MPRIFEGQSLFSLSFTALQTTMRKLIAFGIFCFLVGCGQPADFAAPETDLQAATDFIRYTLDGDFKYAKKLIVVDSLNEGYLEMVERKYNGYTVAHKDSMRSASITINEVAQVVKDSVTVVNYSNSYSKTPFKVKSVKVNGAWMIDLKYTFSGNL